jgi:hypothetical protein
LINEVVAEPILPTRSSPTVLAEEFSQFFMTKVEGIRQGINPTAESINEDYEKRFDGIHLSTLAPTSVEEVTQILLSSPSKSSQCDPIPTRLLKKAIPLLSPLITNIINRSMETSTVPPSFKEATVRPLIKKKGADSEQLQNYRPVSNLPFVAKCLERVVCARIHEHLQNANLHEPMQSAYRRFQSTETALLKVQSDVLLALDRGQCAALVMLDLSAAFDTLEHKVLLNRLQHTHGITGAALNWIQSYLTERTQSVVIENVKSSAAELRCGVPQGSVFGPMGYSMYTYPVGAIIRKHGFDYAIYADDTQFYTLMKPGTSWDNVAPNITACYDEIQKWMSANLLKLNDGKTELIIFRNRTDVDSALHVLQCGNSALSPTDAVKNLGVLMHCSSTMDKHVNMVARSCWFYLRKI